MAGNSPIVIVGASHAGVSLALQLRREGWRGGIQLLGAEPHMPYHRPPLTKEFLAGAKSGEQVRLRPAKLYEDNDIELRLNCRVEALDCADRMVELADGSQLFYEKLALCVGSREHRLPLGENLDGMHYIRSLDQVVSLQGALRTNRRVVIIGGGYIGLEAAAVLCQAGHRVTVIEMTDRVLQRVTGAEMSDYMAGLHIAHGVDIVTGAGVSDVAGGRRVEKVITERGEEYRADLVIVGIGVAANTEIAAAAGLEVDGGIVVDAYTQSSDARVYAAGDCTRHPSFIYERHIRLESVQNANDQARVAAANMAGKRLAYDAVPWFWSDQYRVKLQMAGLSTGYDRIVPRGDPGAAGEDGFALFYLKEGRLIAADCVNRPQEFMASKTLIARRAVPDPSALANESISPKELSAD